MLEWPTKTNGLTRFSRHNGRILFLKNLQINIRVGDDKAAAETLRVSTIAPSDFWEAKLASCAQGRTTKRNENRTQESIEEYHVTSLKSGKASLYISNFILMTS